MSRIVIHAEGVDDMAALAYVAEVVRGGLKPGYRGKDMTYPRRTVFYPPGKPVVVICLPRTLLKGGQGYTFRVSKIDREGQGE